VLRVSLTFLGLGILCLLLADIEVSTLHPWLEIRRMFLGTITPDIPVLYTFRSALLNTVVFAFCGITLGVLFGSVLALFFHLTPVRLFCAFIRAIHEIFWAFLFLPIVGLNPICGVLAIGIPYAGVFAKVYAEIFQEADQRPLQGLPPGSLLTRFAYGILPLTYRNLKSYTSYRFECALRSSAVLGFIGLPTIGFHLETAFRESLYSEAAALLLVFYLLIASLRYWLKPNWVPLYVALAFFFITKDVSVQWENIVRFLGYEIFPWPMRRAGFISGSHELAFSFTEVASWAWRLLASEGMPGLWNTFILTQIVLAGSGFFALILFPGTSRHFVSRPFAAATKSILIILRTTPEYILAYTFILLWGPSMLPAIVAIVLHNGAILAHLSGRSADTIELRNDAPRGSINRYIFEVLPRVYGQFLAFLFYRWEVMMRESAILGILGIYTLGFFIDSAISDDKLDKVVFLILMTAIFNMLIDTISQRVRRNLRVSVREVVEIRE